MGLIVAIQQPEHLPWLGFFEKMARSDLFVLLDNVQFKRRYFENRNRIRTVDGSRWVTVPVRSKGRYTQSIHEVEIDEAVAWRRKYWTTVEHAYSRAPHFDPHAPRFEEILAQARPRLARLNTELIGCVRELVGIDTQMELASSLGIEGSTGSELILRICRELGATTYLSGPDGSRYLDIDSFRAAGIEIEFHRYSHPEYRQMHSPFVPHMSIIDLIFNHGAAARGILLNRPGAS